MKAVSVMTLVAMLVAANHKSTNQNPDLIT
jgi:hypothetical protein